MEPTLKVILVEDNPRVGQALNEQLSRENLTVCLVSSLPEALAQLLSNAEMPDIIISDGQSGFELCRFIRQHETLKKIPIILLTQNCLDQKLACFQVGADDYLVKPFRLWELLARIKILLALTARLGAKPLLRRTHRRLATLTQDSRLIPTLQ